MPTAIKLPARVEDLDLFQAAALADIRGAAELARRCKPNLNQRVVAGMMRGERQYPAARKVVARVLRLKLATLEQIIDNGRP